MNQQRIIQTFEAGSHFINLVENLDAIGEVESFDVRIGTDAWLCGLDAVEARACIEALAASRNVRRPRCTFCHRAIRLNALGLMSRHMVEPHEPGKLGVVCKGSNLSPAGPPLEVESDEKQAEVSA